MHPSNEKKLNKVIVKYKPYDNCKVLKTNK